MDESFAKYYDMINTQQKANNEWSAQQAQKAMEYQTEMSNTAHQREVADLKAAGLNPVLSAGGQGATTGSGHAASAGNANVDALYGMISKVMDAQIAQANAMLTSAAAASGSGSRSGGNSAKDEDSTHDGTGASILKDILKRKLGISPDTTEKILDAADDWKENGAKYTGNFLRDYMKSHTRSAADMEKDIYGKTPFPFSLFDWLGDLTGAHKTPSSAKQTIYIKGGDYHSGDGFSGSSGKLPGYKKSTGSSGKSSGRGGKF